MRAIVELAETQGGVALRLRTTRKAAATAADVLAEAEARLAAMAARGHDAPFGVDATSFATLPSEWAAATSRSSTAEDLEAEADGRAREIGLPDAAAVRRLACPDEEQVRTGIATSDALRVERARVGSTLGQALAERGAARVDAAALLEEGEVASVELLGAARRARDEAWEEIRTSYVGGDGRIDEAGRSATAARLDAGIAEADRLADKRGAEADRVAALAQARRRAAVAEGTIEAAELTMRRITIGPYVRHR